MPADFSIRGSHKYDRDAVIEGLREKCGDAPLVVISVTRRGAVYLAGTEHAQHVYDRLKEAIQFIEDNGHVTKDEIEAIDTSEN